jgi:hypothetical protein
MSAFCSGTWGMSQSTQFIADGRYTSVIGYGMFDCSVFLYVQHANSVWKTLRRKALKNIKSKVKVKLSPLQTVDAYRIVTSRIQHCLDNRHTDGGQFVNITRRPRFTPNKLPGTHSATDRVNPKTIIWSQGLGKLKTKMASSGFEPATFRLPALCFHQLI